MSDKFLSVKDLAKITHEANAAYCESIGDFSQKPFHEAPDWQVESAIKGVQFNLENPDAPASASHDSWLKEKEEKGWKYRPVKDETKKEHPCYVPYEELPKNQQAKDYLFKSIVAALGQYCEYEPTEQI